MRQNLFCVGPPASETPAAQVHEVFEGVRRDCCNLEKDRPQSAREEPSDVDKTLPPPANLAECPQNCHLPGSSFSSNCPQPYPRSAEAFVPPRTTSPLDNPLRQVTVVHRQKPRLESSLEFRATSEENLGGGLLLGGRSEIDRNPRSDRHRWPAAFKTQLPRYKLTGAAPRFINFKTVPDKRSTRCPPRKSFFLNLQGPQSGALLNPFPGGDRKALKARVREPYSLEKPSLVASKDLLLSRSLGVLEPASVAGFSRQRRWSLATLTILIQHFKVESHPKFSGEPFEKLKERYSQGKSILTLMPLCSLAFKRRK
ncbi:hypothetical protein BJ322DRAFT_1023491 [Thelephora terrestris]|uniref:Uncharacterized protein n=1 Tax=Thelephora terrestris TaxID=56493 RepID=A0A9P6H7G0_9AGAM|nr:hypothetical protein BJ322DRAFT_1023491 [Thelephora terrestris]